MGKMRIDVTDRVKVYAHGKTLECDCGQRFGLKYDEGAVKCPKCQAICEDHHYHKRKEQAEEKLPGRKATLAEFA